jgi:hypothetical protein
MSDLSGELLHERSALQVLNLLFHHLTHQITGFIVVYTEAVTFEREFQFRRHLQIPENDISTGYSMERPLY